MRNSKPLIRKTFQNQYRMLSTDTSPSLLPYFRTLQALFIGFIASIFTIGLIMIPFGSLSEDQLLHPIPTLFISVAFYSILLVFLGIFLQPKLLVKSVSSISFFRLLALFTFFFIALDLLSTWIKLPSLAEPILNDQFKQNRGIFFVAVVVVGPIMEELVFRGAILSYLLARSNRLPALLFSSVLFGLIHFSLDQIVWGSIAGIFLGYSYVKSQNIIVPIFFHILNNGIYFFLKCYEDTSSVFDLLKNLG